MSVCIRKAVKEDCNKVFALVKGLAAYENMSDSLVITQEEFLKDGFGESWYHCIVAEKDKSGTKELVGHSIYYFGYSTFVGRLLYLEDIYVAPNSRRKGIGLLFLKELCKIAKAAKCNNIRLNVLDLNTPARNFYKKNGALDLSDTEAWRVYAWDKETICKLSE